MFASVMFIETTKSGGSSSEDSGALMSVPLLLSVIIHEKTQIYKIVATSINCMLIWQHQQDNVCCCYIDSTRFGAEEENNKAPHKRQLASISHRLKSKDTKKEKNEGKTSNRGFFSFNGVNSKAIACTYQHRRSTASLSKGSHSCQVD